MQRTKLVMATIRSVVIVLCCICGAGGIPQQNAVNAVFFAFVILLTLIGPVLLRANNFSLSLSLPIYIYIYIYIIYVYW